MPGETCWGSEENIVENGAENNAESNADAKTTATASSGDEGPSPVRLQCFEPDGTQPQKRPTTTNNHRVPPPTSPTATRQPEHRRNDSWAETSQQVSVGQGQPPAAGQNMNGIVVTTEYTVLAHVGESERGNSAAGFRF